MTITEPTTNTRLDAEPVAAKTFVDIDVTLIDPDPDNRTAVIDKDFLKSILEHGVVEPALVVPHPNIDGRYLLVAGERRWRASVTAELATLPAIVRTDLDEAARIEIQAIENIHRADLTPCQEAHQFMRLAGIGHGVKTLAAKVGRSQRYVRDRLRLAELPTKAQRLVDSGEWSIEAGLAALDLADHPEELATLISDRPRNVAHAVERILADIEFQAEATALVDKAIKDGVTVIAADEVKHETLSALDLDPEAHAGEGCHAVILNGGGFRGKARLVPVCTKVANHRKSGSSALKTQTRPGLSEDERKARAAKREADAARFEAIKAIVTGRLAKAEAHSLIIAALIEKMSADEAKTIARILELDVPVVNGNYRNNTGAVADYAAQSDANYFRVATAIAAVNHDSAYGSTWGTSTKRGIAWSEWLKKHGWKPTAHDRNVIKSMKTAAK